MTIDRRQFVTRTGLGGLFSLFARRTPAADPLPDTAAPVAEAALPDTVPPVLVAEAAPPEAAPQTVADHVRLDPHYDPAADSDPLSLRRLLRLPLPKPDSLADVLPACLRGDVWCSRPEVFAELELFARSLVLDSEQPLLGASPFPRIEAKLHGYELPDLHPWLGQWHVGNVLSAVVQYAAAVWHPIALFDPVLSYRNLPELAEFPNDGRQWRADYFVCGERRSFSWRPERERSGRALYRACLESFRGFRHDIRMLQAAKGLPGTMPRLHLTNGPGHALNVSWSCMHYLPVRETARKPAG